MLLRLACDLFAFEFRTDLLTRCFLLQVIDVLAHSWRGDMRHTDMPRLLVEL